ncbi:hypothetical protein AOA80_04435 [Methanomassiliicoccales archaeon RumEn M1]|nr:hypothetical protein AOA80_04435 [Methanomassiliicoccales archaeon RumEn M1]
MNGVRVGKKIVGVGELPYIIAEGATNHNNRLDLGLRLIREAHSAGAHAIKFQTYTAEGLVTKTAPRFWDMADKDNKAEGTQFDAYTKVDKLSEDAYREMKRYADEIGIDFFSTPFDEKSAEFLETLDVQMYKIASCDVTNIPFLKYIARLDKPIFLSTGISNIGEVQEAVDAIREEGNDKIVLMHCTIKYPTPYENVNLRAMQTMQTVFPDIPIGLSDHSIGIEIPLAAIALGATCIEKHYTFDKNAELSSDHWLAVDTAELGDLVRMSRHIHVAMGSSVKKMDSSEHLGKLYARRSLVANRDIHEGEIIAREDISIKRPGTGIAPKYLDLIVGSRASRMIEEDQVIQWDDVLRRE